jgi:integrase
MDSMNYWMGELASKAPATKLKYQAYFQKFCAFTKKSPDELIAQRKTDMKADDPREQRGIENCLKGFILQLREGGNSPATQQIGYASIKSFFESNEYPLRMKRSDYPKGESLGVRAITKPAIRQILEDTKRMKDKKKIIALVMFLKDTGLGVSDVGNFKYGDVKRGLDQNLEFIPLQLLRQKTKTITKPFLGPEAITALKEYLEERQHGTQRIEPETLTDSSPLFRTNQNGPVKRISRGGLSSMMRFQCCKTGQVKLSAHSFRKYVQTSLDVAGVSPNIIDRILGHVLSGSRDPYSQPTDGQLLDAYRTAYPALRVYSDQNEVAERVSKLEEQIIDRNNTIANLLSNGDVKAAKIQELEQKMAGLEALLQRAMPLVEQLEKSNKKKK